MSRPPELSHRAVALKPSLTLEISAKAKSLRDSGKDICSLSAGEPDFETPQFIVEAAQQAWPQASPVTAPQPATLIFVKLSPTS